MKLIKLGLLSLAMLLVVSVANAQSQIMMEGEYESIYEPGFKVSEHGFIELEYDAEEGGIVHGWRATDYFSDSNCSYTCSFEGTIEPGSWYFEDHGYFNYWRASIQRNYEGTRGPPCNYSFSGSGTITLSIYDYDAASAPDRQYMNPIMTPCHVQTYVYLTVVPEGPGDD